MIKRILLALALSASLGGAVLACNSPSSSGTPTVAPSVPAASTPAASDVPSAEPSAS